MSSPITVSPLWEHFTTSSSLFQNASFLLLTSTLWGICTDNIQHHSFDFNLQTVWTSLLLYNTINILFVLILSTTSTLCVDEKNPIVLPIYTMVSSNAPSVDSLLYDLLPTKCTWLSPPHRGQSLLTMGPDQFGMELIYNLYVWFSQGFMPDTFPDTTILPIYLDLGQALGVHWLVSATFWQKYVIFDLPQWFCHFCDVDQ